MQVRYFLNSNESDSKTFLLHYPSQLLQEYIDFEWQFEDSFLDSFHPSDMLVYTVLRVLGFLPSPTSSSIVFTSLDGYS